MRILDILWNALLFTKTKTAQYFSCDEPLFAPTLKKGSFADIEVAWRTSVDHWGQQLRLRINLRVVIRQYNNSYTVWWRHSKRLIFLSTICQQCIFYWQQLQQSFLWFSIMMSLVKCWSLIWVRFGRLTEFRKQRKKAWLVAKNFANLWPFHFR